MTRHREPTTALTGYIDALIGIGGQLTIAARLIKATSKAIEQNPFLVNDTVDDDEPFELPFDPPQTNRTDRLH